MLLCVVHGKDILWFSQFKIRPSLREVHYNHRRRGIKCFYENGFFKLQPRPILCSQLQLGRRSVLGSDCGVVVFASKRAYLHTLLSTRAICQRECRGTSPVWKEVSKNFELFLVFLRQVELDPEYSCTLLVCRFWSQVMWHNWTSSILVLIRCVLVLSFWEREGILIQQT